MIGEFGQTLATALQHDVTHVALTPAGPAEAGSSRPRPEALWTPKKGAAARRRVERSESDGKVTIEVLSM